MYVYIYIYIHTSLVLFIIIIINIVSDVAACFPYYWTAGPAGPAGPGQRAELSFTWPFDYNFISL